jgi:hypothetical protein
MATHSGTMRHVKATTAGLCQTRTCARYDYGFSHFKLPVLNHWTHFASSPNEYQCVNEIFARRMTFYFSAPKKKKIEEQKKCAGRARV